MKKIYYRLMARGTTSKCRIRNKIVDVKDIYDKEVFNVPFLSPIKYVVAKDEDVARAMIREKLTNNKWTGSF